MQVTSFSSEVAQRLGFYVYAYVDPRNGEIFYIGKGKGDRAFYHLDDCGETRKVVLIREIKAAGSTPQIHILVHGLTEKEALRIEAVCIDTIGFSKLTNLVSGHSSVWGGRRSVESVVDEFTAEAVEIQEPSIGITVNQTYFYGMSEEELYEATRGVWVVAERRASCNIALSIYQGVIKEVYTIQSWHPAGTTQYQHRQFNLEDLEGRWEFTGQIAPLHLRDKYIGKRIFVDGQLFKSSQNPIRYFNC